MTFPCNPSRHSLGPKNMGVGENNAQLFFTEAEL